MPATAVARPTNAVTLRGDSPFEQALFAPAFVTELARFFPSDAATQVFLMSLWNQASTNPDIYQCTPESVQYQVIRLAQLKLNPTLPNEVALIPRWDRDLKVMVLHADLGYVGLRELALRGGEMTDILCKEVCINDEFEPPVSIVDKPHHRLPSKMAPRGRVIGYYCAILLTNDHWRYEQMSVGEVENHVVQFCTRKNQKGESYVASPAWQNGKRPKVDVGFCAFDGMALKTVLRKALSGRNVRRSVELNAYIQEAEVVEDDTRRPTAAMQQGYTRLGERNTSLPALEQGKSLVGHIEDVYPPGPATASRTGTPLPPQDQTVRSGPPLDEAEFSYRIEAIWRGAGLTEPQMEEMRARLLRRCGVTPIPAKWYGQLLEDATKWAVKQRETAEKAREGAQVPEDHLPPPDATVPVQETTNGVAEGEPPMPVPSPPDAPETVDTSWRTIEMARGAVWLSGGLTQDLEALYDPDTPEPTPQLLAQLAERVRQELLEAEPSEQLGF
jgi:phage RecT family recombinase